MYEPVAILNIPPDEGCSIAPRCLSCPLPRCRFDEPDRWREEQEQAAAIRDAAVMRDLAAGLPIRQVAERHRIGSRTVLRIKQRAQARQTAASTR